MFTGSGARAADVDSANVWAFDSTGRLTVSHHFGRRYFDPFAPGIATRQVITAPPDVAEPHDVFVQVMAGRWFLRGIRLTDLATSARYSTGPVDLWLASADHKHRPSARLPFQVGHQNSTQ